jgi:hypothetical protein
MKGMKMWRWLFTTILVLFTTLLWYMTLTVPMVSATAPAILALTFSGITYVTWPRHKEPKQDPLVH